MRRQCRFEYERSSTTTFSRNGGVGDECMDKGSDNGSRNDGSDSCSPRKGKAISKAKTKKIVAPEPDLEFGAILGNNELTLTLPLRTLSPNQCEPWRKRHARHKEQKRAVIFSMMAYKEVLKMPCTIRCIRYAPKAIDAHDNLPMSFKAINDQVCAEITGDHRPGRADGWDGLTFEYDQVKSKKYAVKIIIRW